MRDTQTTSMWSLHVADRPKKRVVDGYRRCKLHDEKGRKSTTHTIELDGYEMNRDPVIHPVSVQPSARQRGRLLIMPKPWFGLVRTRSSASVEKVRPFSWFQIGVRLRLIAVKVHDFLLQPGTLTRGVGIKTGGALLCESMATLRLASSWT